MTAFCNYAVFTQIDRYANQSELQIVAQDWLVRFWDGQSVNKNRKCRVN